MSVDVEAAVVRIRRGGVAVGAGFLAGPGRVLTCAHVVAEALGLAGTPTEPPQEELELDFPLRAAGAVLRARVSADCWVPIDPQTGRGDVAGLELLAEPPAGVSALRLVPVDDLFRHEFATFGFPAPQPGFGGDPLSEAGVWAHGRILGRQAVGHVQLEGTSDVGFRIEPGFSGSPIWDLELRGAVGMTVTSDVLPERRTAYCIAASDLLAAWAALDASRPPTAAGSVLVMFASVDGPWAAWTAWWVERHGVPAVLHAVDAGSGEGRLGELGGEARLAVALVSPVHDASGAAAAVADPGRVVAVRVREGGPWPVAEAATSVDLVGRDRSSAEATLGEAFAAAGFAPDEAAAATASPVYPPDLAGRRVDAGVAEHRERLIEQSERRQTERGRRVAGRPPLDVGSYFKDRERERERIRELLADPATRLVVVVGRGGMGKTAVACQVLGELEEKAAAGGWDDDTVSALVYLSTRTGEVSLERIFRECGSLVDAEARMRLERVWVNQELELGGKVDRLLEELGESLVVVLLDNLEDLLGPDGRIEDPGIATFVEQTLAGADHGTRLLVTTREPIALSGPLLRHDRRVPLESGLPLADGVALLRELDPDGTFELRDAPEKKLERAVERLHGVPRALEVLASVAATDFASLDRLLEDFYDEERVVADLVETSYRRLDGDSRLVLSALAVFTRPVPVAAVAALVTPLVPGLDVQRVVWRLARIYLVRIDRETETLSLHPVDRDYALSLLPDDGPGGRRALELAAADYWARVRIPPESWASIADVEPQLLEIEHRFAAGDLAGAAETLSLVDGHPLAFTWDAKRLLALRERLDGALEDPRLLMLHSYGLGQIYSMLGPVERQRECVEDALQRARELGDPRWERDSLAWLGDTYRRMGDQDGAYAVSEQAAALYREVGDAVGESHALSQMSLADAYRRRAEEAYELGERALEVAGADARSAGLAHDALTLACYLLGRLDEALEHAERALALYDEAHASGTSPYVVNEQGLVYLRQGRTVEAIEALERGRTLSVEVGSPRLAGLTLFNLAHAYLAHGDAETARARAEAAAEALAGAGEPGGAEGARALADAARARAADDAAGEAEAVARSARAVGWNPDLYAP